MNIMIVIKVIIGIIVLLMLSACGDDEHVTTPLPTISSTPAETASIDSVYSFTPKATHAASFSINGIIPPGLSFNTTNGTLSGTPTTVGIYRNIIITATNVTGSASLEAFTLTVPMTFESLKHVDTIEAYYAPFVDEGGYRLSAGIGAFSSVGTLDPRFTGTTSLFGRYIPMGIELYREDGARFNIKSIDLAFMNNPPDGNLTMKFCGQTDQPGSCTVVQTFTLAQLSGSQTFKFNSEFSNLSTLVWYQGISDLGYFAPTHQFSNIVVEKAVQ